MEPIKPLPDPAFDSDKLRTDAMVISTPLEKSRTPILQWTAPLHPIHERSQRWYIAGGIVVLILAAYGIVVGNWTLSVLSLLLGGMYFLVRHAPSVMQTIVIEKQGFQFGDTYTYWEECKEFWLVRTPNYTELHIRPRKALLREKVIQTNGIDPLEIVATLSPLLKHSPDQKERLIDALIRILKL